MFSDSPQIIQLLDCFSTLEKFDESLIEYPEPMLRECGGFLSRLCKSYTVRCDFDDRLLSAMMLFQKEELYVIVADKFHQNVPNIKFILMILHKALKYQQEPKIIIGKLTNLLNDVYVTLLNMFFQWLLSVNSSDAQLLLNSILLKFAAFNEQLPNLLKQLREDLLIVNAAHQSASETSSAAGSHQRPLPPDPITPHESDSLLGAASANTSRPRAERATASMLSEKLAAQLSSATSAAVPSKPAEKPIKRLNKSRRAQI